jgi:hypothetical protein
MKNFDDMGPGVRTLFSLALMLSMYVPTVALAQEAVQGYKPFRYDEDYRYLRDPTLRSDFWDPLKYIPLGGDPNTYLSFGGELRERFESYSPTNFGLKGGNDNAYVLHRLLLSADLHITQYFRAFLQLGNELAAGKNQPLSPTDVDRLDLQQAFIDVKVPISELDPTLRIGRQEMSFGSQRLVSAREPPNIRRSFDGLRLFDTIGSVRLDAFVTRPVQLQQGVFDDYPSHQQVFWGVYTTVQLAPTLSVDLYYLGLDDERAHFGSVAGGEHRHSVGTRVFGNSRGWDWNFEAVGQFGGFAGREIRAWTVASDSGYTISALPWTPRLGLKANIASGDRNPHDGSLNTFNPLFPKYGYFSEAALIAPSNFFDFQPSLSVAPVDNLTITVGWDFLWRQTTRDGVYLSPLTPVAGTAGHGGQFTGHQVSLDVDWQVNRHVEVKGSYVHFTVADALRNVGGRNVDFALVSAAYKF